MLVKNRHNALITGLIVITMFLIVVFPNAFRLIKVPLFVIILLFINIQLLKMPRQTWGMYLFGITLTFIYLLVGLTKATQPFEVTVQVLIIYVLSPLFWLLISYYIIKNYQIKKIVQYLNFFAIVGSATVLIGFWLFDNGYKDILEYIIDNPNQSFTDTGVTAIRFHVYGSLIFLFPAQLQLYNKINGIRYMLMVVLMVIIGIISGRDALILSILIGFSMFIILSRGRILKSLIYIIPAVLIFMMILDSYGVNLVNTLTSFREKIQAGGGSARTDQFHALLEGINNNHVLGSGHGVGVSVIRSVDYPWRYELLTIATVYRVGLIGFIIYALPALIAAYFFLKKYLSRSNTVYDNYFFSGLLSLCVAAFTNPYLESFEFQWGYFFVFVYFLTSSLKGRSSN